MAASRDDVEAFAEFYRRHVEQVHGFFLLRVRDRERAADMTAEVFAAALGARRSYRPGKGPATTWLFAIARHKLIDAARHAQHGDRARRKLGMPVRDVAGLDPATTLEPELAAAELLADMPPGEREAVALRVIWDRTYGEIAADLGCTEQAARQRVSRGLSRLRLKTRQV